MIHFISMKISQARREETCEIRRMTVRECACPSFTPCYPEHTVTLTWYHKEKESGILLSPTLWTPWWYVPHTLKQFTVFPQWLVSRSALKCLFRNRIFWNQNVFPREEAASSFASHEIKKTHLLLCLKDKAGAAPYFSCFNKSHEKRKTNTAILSLYACMLVGFDVFQGLFSDAGWYTDRL